MNNKELEKLKKENKKLKEENKKLKNKNKNNDNTNWNFHYDGHGDYFEAQRCFYGDFS